jgi:hypothetical protein
MLPTRHGVDGPNGLGFLHYGFQHNITSERAIKTAYENNYPAVENGTHLEYLAFLVDSTGGIDVTVRVVDEQSSRSSDGAYTVPDGTPIGTITAFCEGLNVCPNSVN